MATLFPDKSTKSLKKKTVHNNIWYVLFFSLIVIYQYFDFSNSRNVQWEIEKGMHDRKIVHIMLFLVILYSGIYYFFANTKKQKEIKKDTIFFWCLFLWSLVVEILSNGSLWLICIYSGLSLLWIFIIVIGYDIALQWSSSKFFFGFFMYFTLGLSIYFFLVSYQSRLNAVGTSGVFNIAYNVLAFVPFLLLESNKKINRLFLIVAMILVFISSKRGAIITYLGMCVGFFVLKNDIHKNLMKLISYIVIFAILFVIAFQTIDSYTDGKISSRFSTEEIQDGSGRKDQYSDALKIWRDIGNPLQQLCGFGATNFQASLGISLHNEFLAWMCYYGLIGLFLFIMFLRSLIKKQIELQRNNSPYSSVHIAILLSFLVTSLVSAFFFMHMTMYYMLTLGVIWGLENKRLSELSAEEEPQLNSK